MKSKAQASAVLLLFTFLLLAQVMALNEALASGFTVIKPVPTLTSTGSNGAGAGNHLIPLMLSDGTTAIKDSIHNTAFTMTGGVSNGVNLLNSDDSSFESGIGSWQQGPFWGVTFASSTDQAYTGTHSGKMTLTNTGERSAAMIVTPLVTPGKKYTLSAMFKGATGTSYRLCMRDDVSGYSHSTPVASDGTWQRLTLTKTFDAGTTVADIFLETNTDAQVGDVVYWDEVTLCKCDYSNPSNFESLLGVCAPVITQGDSMTIPRSTIGITPGMPISIVCVVNKVDPWDDLNKPIFSCADSSPFWNGIEIAAYPKGYIGINNWTAPVGYNKYTGTAVNSTNWAPNVPHIIVATIDPDNSQRLFLDGVEGFITGGAVGRETAMNNDIYIGTDHDTSLPIDGSILCAVYSGILTDAEIATISAMTDWRTLSSPLPTLTSVTPSSVTAGSPDVPVSLVGTDFVPTSVVQWKGTPLSTAFVDATHLTATIPAADLKTAGVFPINVFNNVPDGGTSSPQYFTVAPPTSFYFAEGYTGPDFQEYLCLSNPSSKAADADVTYLFADGTTRSASYSVSATGRTTVNVNSEVGPDKEVGMRVVSGSPWVVAERPMYFNYKGVWTGGSDAMGATSPNVDWYFAEGNTLDNFDEYVTLLNPGDTAADLTFHYMVEGQGEKDASGSVGAHSRATFKTRDQIGSNLNASLYLSSNQPVVAERPMYFDYHGAWTGGHDVVGTNSPAKAWYLAEGTTRAGFEEWLCLENPGSSPVRVNARYLLGPGQGAPMQKSYTVPARQRLTVSVNREIGPNKDDSVALTSTGDFIAERPMYFNYHDVWTGGHDVLGANSSAATWFFAEGTTRVNFNEWLCLQNPGSSDAHVTITYYTASGQAIPKNWTVPANSRLTVNVNQDAGANQDVSAKVSSDKPIIAERPMYFDYNGWTGGHDVVGFAL